jgi:adenine/guanine phosphoribosyltransferase-like PRPP-binding protein
MVKGKRVLVFDDVHTEGLTLRELALALRQAGAAEVSEIVLVGQPSDWAATASSPKEKEHDDQEGPANDPVGGTGLEPVTSCL